MRSLYVSTSPDRDFASLLAPSPPPRREAAPTPLTIRIAFPRTTAFAPEPWLPAGKYPPRRLQQRYPQLSFKTFVVVVAAAPRSGAIASTRPIAVRRAGIFNVLTQAVSMSRTSRRIDVPRAWLSPESKFLRCAAFIINTKAANQNLRFQCPPTNAFSGAPEFSSPAARATSSSSAPPSRLGNSRFRGPASEPLGLSGVQIFLSAARRPPSEVKTIKLFKSVKSSKSKKIFFAARPTHPFKTINLLKFVKSAKMKKIFCAARLSCNAGFIQELPHFPTKLLNTGLNAQDSRRGLHISQRDQRCTGGLGLRSRGIWVSWNERRGRAINARFRVPGGAQPGRREVNPESL
ncbi:hypothetical protein R3P38DRAFT_2800293 [Favolaschia claudopus]|uniref:Uncharacterized protein n=1 Tax=Favolaschia claudopus TaxID=2862362 RepID=A0AAV9ZXI6_9AGAR